MEKPTVRLVASSNNPDGSAPVDTESRYTDSFFKSVQW